MDLHLKQWRNQHESEEEEQQHHQSKIPKLYLDHHQPTTTTTTGSSALPLFVSEEPNTKLSCLNNMSDPSSTLIPKMGSYFSIAQWQELELQALIYRYMLAGATVPQELLQHVRKSLFHSATTTPYFLHQHYQPACVMQSGYWSRAAMDPEPGRCRRTDGKKWRCSRDVVAGQKYCERHVHRGRNRSRKPVENNTTTTGIATNNINNSTLSTANGGVHGGGGAVRTTSQTTVVCNSRSSIGYNGQALHSIDLHHLNQSPSDSKNGSKGLFGEVGAKSDVHVLRHFFDDWPKPLQDRDNNNNGSSTNSATCLSISMPGNSPSDVSLKLSTGNLEEVNDSNNNNNNNSNTSSEREVMMNWAGGWASAQGGPLAEALRSSTTTTNSSCPTSVLHQLPRGSASEAYVTT